MQKSFWRWQRSDRYIPTSSPLPRPLLPFFPSLISLVVSVDVKHHVYFRKPITTEDVDAQKLNTEIQNCEEQRSKTQSFFTPNLLLSSWIHQRSKETQHTLPSQQRQAKEKSGLEDCVASWTAAGHSASQCSHSHSHNNYSTTTPLYYGGRRRRLLQSRPGHSSHRLQIAQIRLCQATGNGACITVNKWRQVKRARGKKWEMGKMKTTARRFLRLSG